MSPQAGLMLVNEVAPYIYGTVPRVVTPVGTEDTEELCQDAMAMAAKMLHNAEKNKRKFGPCNIAYYTLQHQKSGRRSVGNSAFDVLATGTRLKGCQVMSADETFPLNNEDWCEVLTLSDMADTIEDPSVTAARNLDWEAFTQRQSKRGRAILKCLNEGRPLADVARKYRVCSATIQNDKRRLATDLMAFMGPDIIHEVSRPPRWHDNLHATKLKLASKEERERL